MTLCGVFSSIFGSGKKNVVFTRGRSISGVISCFFLPFFHSKEVDQNATSWISGLSGEQRVLFSYYHSVSSFAQALWRDAENAELKPSSQPTLYLS